MSDLYQIRHDVPPPRRKPIDAATRRGKKPGKVRRTMEALQIDEYFDVPLADFPSYPDVKTLLSRVSAIGLRTLGAGNSTTEGHEDFVRVWRIA
nr:hypothetical protein [uncultured Dongia sp.]